jgi:excisionase family DNA binding protein
MPVAEKTFGPAAPPRLLGYDEAVAILNIGKRSLERMVATIEIPVVRRGRSMRFTRAAIERFLAESEARGVACPDGTEHVISRYRDPAANLRTQFGRYIAAAGLTPWPKPWQNLRSSRATELADQYPSHVCAAWLGHTEAVADEFYRQVTEEHYARATGAAHERHTNPGGLAQPQKPESPQVLRASGHDDESCSSVISGDAVLMGAAGTERASEFARNPGMPPPGGALPGARGEFSTDSDPEINEALAAFLALSAPGRASALALLRAWPTLPADAKAVILAMGSQDSSRPAADSGK